MNNEVMSMKQRSLDIINSIEEHQSIIQGCEKNSIGIKSRNSRKVETRTRK
jgi:hypothetical protein